MSKNNNETVQARIEPLTLPTYPAQDADKNPMFFEYRNIQGARGNIYPSAFTDQLSSKKVDRTYQAVFLENEFIELILLPEIGGRIFAGRDKTNGYDFFYRHTVIKPALIGLFGPWISGGVEFNWPQHHRPGTFTPTDFTIEEHSDGSKTVWMSEHDPLNRTKGMVGICLYPGKAVVETKVRLFNRTSSLQTFLWWENVGVHINEKYQVIFPPDVHYAVFHTKAIITEYPIAKGIFNNGIDFGNGTDVSWYVNSPAPTSFFAGDSKYEFFGGYDHASQAGVVHVASRHISPGKKFFTWGNGPSSRRWQNNLMDDEGEYLELMAGVYTDNQPDFSWIRPYETKTFSQFWYPVQKIGPMKNANTQAALNLEVVGNSVHLGIYSTEAQNKARITLSAKGNILLDEHADLGPGNPWMKELSIPEGLQNTDLLLRLFAEDGKEIIRYQPDEPWDGKKPEPFQPPASPTVIGSVEDLYLIGLHLEQYRHPFISPDPYWEEALRRDPGDSRTNIALGRSEFRRGNLEKAEAYFRTAVKRITSWNFNPNNGEAHYFLGLTLHNAGKTDEAYDVLYKATWDAAWQSAAFYRLALIDVKRGDFNTGLTHIEQSLQNNMQNTKSRNLTSAVLRHLGKHAEAEELSWDTLKLDPLDYWARNELVLTARETGKPRVAQQRLDEMHRLMRGDVQTYLDIALDYASAGLWDDTCTLLGIIAQKTPLHPMVAYAMGRFAKDLGSKELSAEWYRRGAAASPDYCFPWRLEEMVILRDVLEDYPEDARAHYYLGNLLYDKKNYAEAKIHWQESVRLDPDFAIPWRNLGLAVYNQEHDLDLALEYMQKANAANPQDPRVLLELDQLLYRKAYPAKERLERLEARPDVVNQRDDLVSQRIMLSLLIGQPEKALEIINQRSFHPWEGGEGSVAEHYANAHWVMGRQALENGNPAVALEHFAKGQEFPVNLGEMLSDSEVAHLIYYSGLAHSALGEVEAARQAYEKVLTLTEDLSLVAYFRGLALQKLGRMEDARTCLIGLLNKAEEMASNPPGSNFFYYGNPNPIFEDNPKTIQKVYFTFLAGMARLGMGDKPGARSALGQVLAVEPTRLLAYEEYKRL
jgi:tetratricopeptide (TPR) repeat protein